jgi:hypothetical protein
VKRAPIAAVARQESEAWRAVAEQFGPDERANWGDDVERSLRPGICSALRGVPSGALQSRMRRRLFKYHPDTWGYIPEFGQYKEPDARAMACLWFAEEAAAGVAP